MIKPRVTIIFGTRPEAIKLAPVVKIFRHCKQIETRIILTGQHKEMVSQVLKIKLQLAKVFMHGLYY